MIGRLVCAGGHLAMPRHGFFVRLFAALFGVWMGPAGAVCAPVSPGRPHILWLTCEDTGQQFGCYGDAYAETPQVDGLARRSLRFKHVWSVAPVCAPSRTALITGLYPSSLGAEHMRSYVKLPAGMKLYPQLLREHGYYCSNNSKEDYNVEPRGPVWDDSSPRAHWSRRPPGKPFFAVFNFTQSHESRIRSRPHELRHDPARARVPAYHPDTPEVRRDWAQFYDQVTAIDGQAGQRLAELQEAGLAGDTIVFFFGDHGCGMPRSKRWPYNSGLEVALLVHVPPKFRHLAPPEYAPGAVSERLVSFVDFAPTLLSLAGAPVPREMQGVPFMGPEAKERGPGYLHGERGRMDERLDLVRSTRDERYVYIRNYMPHLPYGQRIDYMFQTPTTRVWKSLYDEGRLEPPRTFFWEPKPEEELYDLHADPDEVRNLAGSYQHRGTLRRLRRAQQNHLREVRDLGFAGEVGMHERAGGRPPGEWGRNPKGYPMNLVLAAAERAARRTRDQRSIEKLRRDMGSSDAAVRAWAMTGIHVRGPEVAAQFVPELGKALLDSSAAVRIGAAELIVPMGGEPARQALLVLSQHARADRHGVYASIQALNAIERLGAKAQSLWNDLVPDKDPEAHARLAEYGPRLLESIRGRR